MSTPAWLVERPIAHRGLHDKTAGRLENSRAAGIARLDAPMPITRPFRRWAAGKAWSR